MSETHLFAVSVDWMGGVSGSGFCRLPNVEADVPLAVPHEFGGPGGGANPEELLTAAVASCYSMTFGIIAANRNLPVKSFGVEARGEVEKAGASLTFRKILIRPTIVAAEDATEDQLKSILEMSHKADLYCIVTNSIRGKVEVQIEPVVSRSTASFN